MADLSLSRFQVSDNGKREKTGGRRQEKRRSKRLKSESSRCCTTVDPALFMGPAKGGLPSVGNVSQACSCSYAVTLTQTCLRSHDQQYTLDRLKLFSPRSHRPWTIGNWDEWIKLCIDSVSIWYQV